jgi:hypothetical protein
LFFSKTSLWNQVCRCRNYIFSFPSTGCTHVNNSHMGTVIYLINKNDSILILIIVKNCTDKCLMLSKFFQRLVDRKQRVNKKQNVEIDSSASNRVQVTYMLASLSDHLRQHCQFLTLSFFVKTHFLRSVKNKGDCHQC